MVRAYCITYCHTVYTVYTVPLMEYSTVLRYVDQYYNSMTLRFWLLGEVRLELLYPGSLARLVWDFPEGVRVLALGISFFHLNENFQIQLEDGHW